MDVSDLRRTSTKVRLTQLTDEGPREVEVKFSHAHVLCPDILRACAEIERTESDMPAATRLLLACELTVIHEGQRAEFSPEMFDLQTQEVIAAEVFKPAFIELHKWDGFTPSERLHITIAEAYAAFSGLYLPQAAQNAIDKANEIIRRKQDAYRHQQV